jgi:hypothetical protein
VSSVVLATESGELVVGAAAEAQLGLAPERAERTPKRRLGDEVMLLGSRPVRPVEAVAAVLGAVSAEAIRRQGGEPPSELRLTHPARWGSVRRAKLSEAAVLAGLPEPVFVPEPVAAAVYFADERVDEGAYVAVYDLGGGTFDTAVLRRSGDGFDVVGIPGGSERLGGESFDERLFLHVGERIAADDPDAWEQLRFSTDRSWRKAGHDLRSEVRRAKEALSANAEYTVYVGSPVDAAVLVTRDELEALIGDDVRSTVDELEATVQRAGISIDQLAAVNLAGGSSRIPLVTRLVAERFGQVPQTWGDPKAAVALGAVKATRLTSVTPTASGSTPLDATPVVPLPEQVGGLEVLAELGRGGMGVVYLARQPSVGRLVAIKSLPVQDPNLTDRLRREAAVLAELQHPNIATVIDVATDDRGTHVVMPYFPGGTASHLLGRDGRLDPAVTVSILAAVAEALAATHDKGFLHRDVKPSNVLLSEAGDVYLADFGLALPMLDSSRLTNSRSVLGTAPYTAPEILSDEAPTPAADTYSLGVTGYQLLTGDLPYAGSNVLAVLDAVRRGSPEPIDQRAPDVPPALAALVASAFAADPADRPTDLRAWAAELRAAVEPAKVQPAPPAAWAAAAAGAAVVASAAVVPSVSASDADRSGALADVSDVPTASGSDVPGGSAEPVAFAGADASEGDEVDLRPRRKAVFVGIAAAVVLALVGTAFALTRDGEPDSIEVASAAAIESPEATTTTTTAAPVATSPLPDVRGKSKDEAVGLLTGAGFTPVVTELENAAPAGTPLGSVYAMDPLPFTEHPAGTTVTIAVATRIRTRTGADADARADVSTDHRRLHSSTPAAQHDDRDIHVQLVPCPDQECPLAMHRRRSSPTSSSR